jgi:hypothetical protein
VLVMVGVLELEWERETRARILQCMIRFTNTKGQKVVLIGVGCILWVSRVFGAHHPTVCNVIIILPSSMASREDAFCFCYSLLHCVFMNVLLKETELCCF